MAEGRDRLTGDYNEFWAGRDYLNVTQHITAAVLMSHAFNDWNVMPEHSYRISAALKGQVPLQMYYHQGGHGGPPPLDMMNKWFTRYVYGVENGVENDPKAWIVRMGDDRLQPTPYADYPNPASEDVTLYPQAGGEQSGMLTFDMHMDQGVETIVDNVSFTGKVLAQAEDTNHRLMYVTHKLTQDVHISGTMRAKMKISSSKPAANLSVWVVSLPWREGRQAKGGLITRGWADPQNHTSMTESSPLVPGEFYELEFNLEPDDQMYQSWPENWIHDYVLRQRLHLASKAWNGAFN